ncbi:MAG: DtxR family Mn-dependent transcriptional regulator [Flavobacteriales bacterium]|jgi:DtxR family Mn-dependent transcriptional regulator
MASHVEENYLKCIYGLGLKSPEGVSTNSIAQKIEATAPSVSDMLKKLSAKGWVDYKKYKGASLTDTGLEIAIEVIRKQRLWEVFLVEKLDFKWDEVHDLAEQLEHIRSKELTNRLDAFLDRPRVDPHGDPIPDAEGKILVDKSSITLSRAQLNQALIVVGVKDSSNDFLRYLDSTGLTLGAQLEVQEHYSFDQSLLLKFAEGQIQVSAQVAKNLIVKPS